MEVGSEGDALVLRAWQPAFNRTVAVRLLPHRRVEDVEADVRRMASLAGHPNVATVHELGVTAEGVPCLVTELFDGGLLADRLAREGPLGWYDAVSVTVKVAGVVEAGRRAGATGVTVTPADVFLSRFDEPTVALFHRVSPADGTEADGLRSFLQSLLTADGPDPGTYPASVRAAVSDEVLDVRVWSDSSSGRRRWRDGR